MPRKITARDSASGKTVTFNWDGADPPTDADMDEVFQAARTQAPAYKPEPVYLKAKGIVNDVPEDAAPTGRGPVSNAEPDTYWGGFMQSLKDQAREAFTGVQPVMQGAAHPQTADDVASLLIPSELGMGRGGAALASEFAGRSGQAFKKAAQQTGSTIGKEGVIRGALRFPIRSYQAFEDALPSANARAVEQFRGTRGPAYVPPKPTINTARDIPLSSAPPPGPLTLAEQIERIPQTPAPTPARVPFTEKPAYTPQPPAKGRLRQYPIEAAEEAEPAAAAAAPKAATPGGATVTGVPELSSPPTAATGGLSDAERAQLVRQNYPPHIIEQMDQQLRAKAGGPGGVVPTEGVKAAPPVLDPGAQAIRDQTAARPEGLSVSTAKKLRDQLEAMPESVPSHPDHAAWAKRHDAVDDLLTQRDPGFIDQPPRPAAEPHPLDPSRKGIGAEKTGRLVGKTKQEIRDVATPVLGEAQGEASPILPQKALNKIVETMKALPPGPEREAYVARATSGKAQWQIENIRRTLEALGLIVPAAAATPTLRDLVKTRLQPQEQQ